ncbi:MAG: 2-oxoacid:acceptor oxidoreductase subunit alpha [Myxococcales bacterium]|nr:2-oxoacid:acceptor oxidoreductase subunit alpha [Myxococcales bacterium]
MADLNLVIAGAAGQGVQSAAAILGRLLLRQGLHVFVTQDYQSRIRGGHNFMAIRIADRPVSASVRNIHYLIALNEESLRLHLPNLQADGLALCMAEDRGEVADPRIRALPAEVGPVGARNAKYVGVKLMAMFAEMTGFTKAPLIDAVQVEMGKRLKPEVLQLNLEAIDAAAAFVAAPDRHALPFQTDPGRERLFLEGNEALALGLIAGGIGVYAGYPMSPATSVLNTLAEFGAKAGIVVEQVEDEIAALNVALGAAFAGARAAAGTSGAGISLMSEAIGLAGISETPVVVIDAQRPGPSTGMATRTEQSDLLFVAHASQGEFPRIILAPTDHRDAFYLGAEALNLAERWQVPVFIMTDQVLADAQQTVDEFDLSTVKIERGAIAAEPPEPTLMKRYAVTPSGVSPRAIPTQSKWIVQQDSHEHTEVGHLSDNRENRVRQVDKRERKRDGIAAEFPGPEIVGDPDGTLFLAWGSTVGPVLEAAELLRARGRKVGVAVFRHLFPMNKERTAVALSRAARRFTIEVNQTGQLGKLLLLETGLTTDGHLGKYDGRLFTVQEALARLEEALAGC